MWNLQLWEAWKSLEISYEDCMVVVWEYIKKLYVHNLKMMSLLVLKFVKQFHSWDNKTE